MGKNGERRALRRMEREMEKDDVRTLRRLEGKKRRHILRKLLLGSVTLFCILVVAGYFIFDVDDWQQLDLQKILGAAQTGVLYDRSGNFITQIQSSQLRYSVPLSQVPKDVQNAFLAAEDLRFYEHPGFDLVRIGGAVIANLKSSSYAQGASTITQQLIKLSHLSSKKTIARKLEEIYLAIQLENQCSKSEILEMYLNYVYFGKGAYGIEAAAQAYFGVRAQDLTLAQGVSLAAAIKAPSQFALHLNEENNRSRRNYILQTMLENSMIDESAYQTALTETLTVKESKADGISYGWYIDAALDEAESILSLSPDELLCSGYHIYTALDTAQQEIIDGHFAASGNFPADAKDGTPVQGAMASIDVQTGAVRAIVGGRSYDVQRGLNRATQLRRQPGSALKPLSVYAPALEYHGYTTASVLDDTPRSFGNYKPRNAGYKYYGNVTVRTALKLSLNVACVGLLDRIGVDSARRYLTNAGIPLDDRDANLSLALGAMTYGVSPVQLAASYAPFANGGMYYAPFFVERIEDQAGNVIYRHEVQGQRILSEQNAYLMTSLLQSVTSSGTGSKLSGAGVPVAGKTGTVNMESGGNRDIWMAAYNSEISTAFWMGFDQSDNAHKLASWVSGGDHTAALATKFFKSYYQGKPKPAFRKADGLVWLNIDKKAIELAGEPMLATKLTPGDYRYSEVFISKNRPWKESNVWNAPSAPRTFHVTHNESGAPVLVITASDSALYRIQRDCYGESLILTELSGGAGETLYYTDRSAKAGIVYTYRIIPVHRELLSSGILLEGKQAVQIAQVKQNNWSSLWEDISERLFGNSATDENTRESLSLFWQSSD
ncbi:MAG: PBP1A family penicillin-binding protein [Clostridiales bacterium]|nr:PBP1A family penicillin-binding protein [Clostridiales bacterium]